MAVAPVMTPDDRSNSPPIISSATAVAMMPVGAATSSQFSVVSASPNVRPLPQKNAQTMTAPMRAPISGEISHRCIGPRCEIRSSAGIGGGSVAGGSCPTARTSVAVMGPPDLKSCVTTKST